MEISAKMVSDLRATTGAGLMDCKKALVEAQGNEEAAIEILRKKGVATAAKKAGRTAAQGLVAAYIHSNNKVGVLIEVACESDFVAKNEDFKAFVKDDKMTVGDLLTHKIATIGEKIEIKRFTRYQI